MTGDFTAAMMTPVPRPTLYDDALRDWQAAHLLDPSWVQAQLAPLAPALVWESLPLGDGVTVMLPYATDRPEASPPVVEHELCATGTRAQTGLLSLLSIMDMGIDAGERLVRPAFGGGDAV